MKIGDRVLCVKGCTTHNLVKGEQYTITDVRDWTSVSAQGVQGIDSWLGSDRFQLDTRATKALRTLTDDLTKALDAVDADPSPDAWVRVYMLLGAIYGEAEKASGIYSPPPTSSPRDPIGSESTRDPIGSKPPRWYRDGMEDEPMIGYEPTELPVDIYGESDGSWEIYVNGKPHRYRTDMDMATHLSEFLAREAIGSERKGHEAGEAKAPRDPIGSEITAGQVSPGTQRYIVTHPHDTSLEKGDVVVMVEDPEFHNWLLRLSDYTLHPLSDIDDQYVHLVGDTSTRDPIGSVQKGQTPGEAKAPPARDPIGLESNP